MKIVTVVGARPQFIKAALVSKRLQELPDIEEILVHTGQHYDDEMSDIFFREMGIPLPKINLGIGSGTHGEQTAHMLEGTEKVLMDEQPEIVMVYGDTNSTLAGALAAAKLGIPVAHVEAGLRSFNRTMPEEINRIMADHLSSMLFAPTQQSVSNLLAEGIRTDKIHEIGDVMYDAALYFGKQAEHRSSILGELALKKGGYILATVHRAENTDDPSRLAVLMEAFRMLSLELSVVVPLHPRTRDALAKTGLFMGQRQQIMLIPPLGYLDMLQLERYAKTIVTDSGGVQKEAFFFRVPCVTLREETEWVELVESGWNRLAPPRSVEHILEIVRNAGAITLAEVDFYGGGRAVERLAGVLQHSMTHRL